MRKTITLLIALVCFVFTLCFGQSIAVKGTIKDKAWVGLPGISVKVKNAQTAVSSRADGSFLISVLPNATLVFSAVGFTTQEISVGQSTSISATLTEIYGITYRLKSNHFNKAHLFRLTQIA